MELWAWLVSAVGPLVKRAFVALGIGWLTYGGASTIIDDIRLNVVTRYGEIPGAIVQILDLFGVGVALGIVLGAMVARLAFMAFKRLGSVLP